VNTILYVIAILILVLLAVYLIQQLA